MTDDLCHCGRPLHYSSDATRRMVELLIADLGPNIDVVVGARTFSVPRHYLALHGLRSEDVPQPWFQGEAKMKTGDHAKITINGRTIDGKIVLASPNEKSIMLTFEAILEGHAGSMPVLMDDTGTYRSLTGYHEVKLERANGIEPSS